ncbi:MAG TPA: MFS transporter [Candidatus Pullichristensenella avicola]|nr:MFS transporter [Candidatus Pullichristensenella avicola]
MEGKTMTYRHTLYACYLGYVTQAICNNLPSLLFVTFNERFGVTLGQLGLLVSINFAIQMLVDLLAVRYVDRIGHRRAVMLAQILSTVGLVLLGVLPYVMENAFLAILLPIAINAVGGGLLEVLVSPIVESLPGEHKEKAMSLLHSFYCWGSVAVVLLSTAYFSLAGMENWRYLPLIWAILPLANAFLYARVPMRPPLAEHERVPVKTLFSGKAFWVFLLMMLCAGASEHAMSQWSSLFAERGLSVSKTMGDLLGPCAFAVLMGLSRLLYGLFGHRLKVRRAMALSAGLCVGCYLLAAFAPHPLLGLLGCALTGFCVGLMWPGALSMVARVYPQGGTAMFAILALAGDVGCSAGPGLVGWVAGGAGLNAGLVVACVFPTLMLAAALSMGRGKRRALETRL